MNGRDILIYLAVKHNGVWDDIFEAINAKENFESAVVERTCSNLNCKAITILDADYPANLKLCYKPPFVLFYHGDISLIYDQEKNLSVVGTRHPTEYGEKITTKLVKSACHNFNIVSGMAKGVDGIAHQTCLNMGGRTIGILPCGINTCYPPNHMKMYNDIKEKGLLISEHPGISPAEKDYFLFRNRIIAAISSGILLTECKIASGSMNSASHAIEQGKTVMCVPTNAGENSGCNQLIANGAYLVESIQDIIEVMKK